MEMKLCIRVGINDKSCKIIFSLIVVVQFRQAYLKNQVNYGDETLHGDWNP